MPSLLTQAETALLLRLSPTTLATWRSRGGGPRFVKLGDAIRYDLRDIETYLQSRRQDAAQ
jgi:predicted DNA-binding transcriptional regulator AlpA